MDLMKDFEGIKKINNDLNIDINSLYELLFKYKEQIGNVFLNEAKDKVICDTDGKYCVHVYIQNNSIIIERNVDEGETDETHNIGENIKSINMSIADRMIEQIYDFLLDYTKHNGEVKEFITGVKKVLYSYQEEKRFSDVFYIKDVDNQDKYEIKNNKLLKEYAITNLESKMREITLNYKERNQDSFNILKYPYTTMTLSKEENENKTTFVGILDTKTIRVTADYTDNHFIVEANDIVIGAIDSLDPVKKNHYRLEINDLDYESLIIAINVIIDLFLDEHED